MRNFVLCGMQFGDEGKGSFVDFLSQEYNANWIVRYNGGSQASHTVTTPEGKIHKFSQLGSGMFNEHAKTFLSSNMVINVDNYFREVEIFCKTSGQKMEDVLSRVYIDCNCLVVTPYHKLLNKLRELSLGENRRGSVGTGVSEVAYLKTYLDNHKNNGRYFWLSINLYELFYETIFKVGRALSNIKAYVLEFYNIHKEEIFKNCSPNMIEGLKNEINILLFSDFECRLEEEYIKMSDKMFEKYPILMQTFYGTKPFLIDLFFKTDNSGLPREEKQRAFEDFTIIFEGAQGLLLDVKYGLKPNTTFLDTTVKQAMKYIKSIREECNKMQTKGHVKVNKIGVAKAFYTRHGKGVFPTENFKMNSTMHDDNQESTFWNGDIRFGWFDAVLFRYAQKINKVKEVYLSSLDVLEGMGDLKVCNCYRYDGYVDDEFEKVFDFYINHKNEVIITDIKCTCKDISKYLEQAKPIYENVDGFMSAVIEDDNGNKVLSKGCENYIRTISNMIHLPITLVSYGPTRNEKMFVSI
ncbi:MAG: adenylosuccinate synthetase [Clostridia bacterium]|nr:adenylosuccinate synthetase [Clostridia bacterium]